MAPGHLQGPQAPAYPQGLRNLVLASSSGAAPSASLGPWSWLEMSDGAGGIIRPISCDTQIDCRQGDITRALFLVSSLLLHVIRVCGVCVFFFFFPFQGINLSLPPPLLPFAENQLVAPGGGGGLASMLPLSGPAQGCRCSWGAGHVNSLYWGARWGYLRAKRGR